MTAALRHPLLDAWRVEHGFGLRDQPEPPGCLRPRQVHGVAIAAAGDCRRDPPPEADGVVADAPGLTVAVVTADCVPVLLAAEGGAAVAAVHAGWRGLAAGVVAQGVDALRRKAAGARVRAVVGPHIGPCCYEVDAPVLDALAARFGALDAVTRATRPGHATVDLGALALRALVAAGLAAEDVAAVDGACTRCDAIRFHSYRRDGPRAGRLVHFISTGSPRRAAAGPSQP